MFMPTITKRDFYIKMQRINHSNYHDKLVVSMGITYIYSIIIVLLEYVLVLLTPTIAPSVNTFMCIWFVSVFIIYYSVDYHQLTISNDKIEDIFSHDNHV